MAEQRAKQLIVVSQSAVNQEQRTERVALFNADGTVRPWPSQAAARADMGTLTSTVAAGANPTKAEFDALRTDVSTLRTLVNDLLAKMRTANQLAS